MSTKFIISECSDLKWFLGMKFEFSDGIIKIGQEKFIDNLLMKFGMSVCKSVSTPLAEKQKFTNFAQTDKPDIDNTTYRSLVGSLNYLALSTRPDLSQVAHALSSFLEVPKMEHWVAAKHVARYLKGTKDFNLTFRKATSVDDNLAGYSDSDWAGNIDNRKSTTGFCFNMCNNSGSISWASKVQNSIATSPAEAEVYACVSAAQELVYLKGILAELNPHVPSRPNLFVDNQAWITLSNQTSHHNKTKHFAIKVHYLRYLCERGELKLEYIPTDKQPADILTKSLGKIKPRSSDNIFW